MFEFTPSRFRIWIFLFFFVSGFTGLIYEVVWTRLLTLVMGNTHYSISTVLTAFMAGLALGSYLGGRWIDRRGNPLVIYALLEGAIGVYCFLIPFFIDAALPVFQWIYTGFQGDYTVTSLLRFMVCAFILIIPAAFMGATLPVLGKFVADDVEVVGKHVGILYAMNTFGAVVGAFTSVFIFMRYFGVSGTIWMAAGLNLVIAGIILWSTRGNWDLASKTEASSTREIEPSSIPPDWKRITTLICFGFSGMAALIYQVAWNRILSLLLGSSVYAFSLILTTFILGLALGTAMFSRLCARFKDLTRTFGLLQFGIGFSALAALPFFADIPFFYRWVYQNWTSDFNTIQWANFLIIFTLIFLPTFFMGAQFPVVIRMVAKSLSTLGHHVGSAYASNTVGTIIGAFLSGFVLIPWLGIQQTLIFAILVNLVVGLYLLAYAESITVNVKTYSLPVVLVLSGLAIYYIQPWNQAVISSGSFMPYRISDLELAVEKKNKILYYEEGTHTTVTTELAVDGNIFLRVNGKPDASLKMDMRTQLLSGYLPMWIHRNPQEVLVIGQGSGVTLGAVEQFPLKQVELVEISPAVIAGSRYFSPFNNYALADPRLRVILEDGRNHLTLTEKKYDVIVSEPSNPWISGIGALFTADFFRLVEKHLKPGGVVCIWSHTSMSSENFKSVVRTFHSVFPYVTVWESIVGNDYLMIGSREPYQLPVEDLQQSLDNPVTGSDLKKVGIRNVRDLVSALIMNQKGVEAFTADAPLHTDDNSLLEFGAPEYIYKNESDLIVRQLISQYQAFPALLRFEFFKIEQQEGFRRGLETVKRSEAFFRETRRRERIARYMEQALQVISRENYNLAIELYSKALKLEPDHVLTHFNLGYVYTVLNDFPKAEAAFQKTVAVNPYYIFGYVELAKVYLRQGKTSEAMNVLEKVEKLTPDDPDVRDLLKFARQQNGGAT